MRTTVTLDEDLARRLKDLAHERDEPFKKVLNEAIRSGLTGGRSRSRPYRVKARPMGKPRVDLTKANALAAALEDQEILRKLEQGR